MNSLGSQAEQGRSGKSKISSPSPPWAQKVHSCGHLSFVSSAIHRLTTFRVKWGIPVTVSVPAPCRIWRHLWGSFVCSVKGRLIPAIPVPQGQHYDSLRKPLILLKPLTPSWHLTYFITFTLILRSPAPKRCVLIPILRTQKQGLTKLK